MLLRLGLAMVGIAWGSEGNVWFSWYTGEQTGEVGEMSPSGQFRFFPIPNPGLFGMAAGPDKNIWFVAGTSGGQIDRLLISAPPALEPSPGVSPSPSLRPLVRPKTEHLAPAVAPTPTLAEQVSPSRVQVTDAGSPSSWTSRIEAARMARDG